MANKITFNGTEYTWDGANNYTYYPKRARGQRSKTPVTITSEALEREINKHGGRNTRNSKKKAKEQLSANQKSYLSSKSAYDDKGSRSVKKPGRGPVPTKTQVRYKDRASAEAAISDPSKKRSRQLDNGEWEIVKRRGGTLVERGLKEVKRGVERVGETAEKFVKDPIGEIEKAGKGIERETKSALKTTENIVKDTAKTIEGTVKELIENPELILSGGQGLTVAGGRSAQENAGGQFQDLLNKFDEELVEPLDDLKDNPLFQASLNFIPGVGPLVAASVSAFSKLDNGQDLTAQDIISIGAGVVSAGASNAYKGVIDAGGSVEEAAAAAEAFRKGSEAAKIVDTFKDVDTVRQLIEADSSEELAGIISNSSLGQRTIGQLTNGNIAAADTVQFALKKAQGIDTEEALLQTYGRSFIESEEFTNFATDKLIEAGVPEQAVLSFFTPEVDSEGRVIGNKGSQIINDVVIDNKDPFNAVANAYSVDIAEGLFGNDGNARAATVAVLSNQETLRGLESDDYKGIAEALKGTYERYVAEGGTLPQFEFEAAIAGEGSGFGFDLPDIDFPDFNLPDLGIDFTGIKNYVSQVNFGDFSNIFEGLPDFNLPDFDLPSFNLPDFNTPEIGSFLNDLKGIDLKSLELAGFDLGSLDLSGLEGIDLGKINLGNLEARGLDLGSLDLSGIDLGSLDLPNIEGVDLGSLDLGDINLDSPNLDLPEFNTPQLSTPDINLPEIPKLELPDLNFGNLSLPSLVAAEEEEEEDPLKEFELQQYNVDSDALGDALSKLRNIKV